MKVRKDDMVKVISGKDRGKTGRVLRTEPHESRVFVEGVNIQKRHQRPRSLRDTQRAQEIGGVIEAEGPIHVSNVMLLDPKSGDPTRVVKREGRPPRARGQEVRHGDRLMALAEAKIKPRLKERYEEEIAPALHQALRLREPDAGPEASRRSR